MRVIGLDVGENTIGVAVCDELGITAQGITTVPRTSLRKDIGKVRKYAQEYGTTDIVVGLPRNMNGSEGSQCAVVRAFASELTKAMPQLAIHWQDERLTTVSATRALLEADVSRAKRHQVVDKMAAVLILQGYLDALNNTKKG